MRREKRENGKRENGKRENGEREERREKRGELKNIIKITLPTGA
jgi:hypothetical protein